MVVGIDEGARRIANRHRRIAEGQTVRSRVQVGLGGCDRMRCVRHHHGWPSGSQPSRLALVAFARFLAAHTPTRREQARIVEIARRLRRNEALFVASEQPDV